MMRSRSKFQKPTKNQMIAASTSQPADFYKCKARNNRFFPPPTSPPQPLTSESDAVAELMLVLAWLDALTLGVTVCEVVTLCGAPQVPEGVCVSDCVEAWVGEPVVPCVPLLLAVADCDAVKPCDSV